MIRERKRIEDLIVGLKFKTKATKYRKYQHTKHNNERTSTMQLRIDISLVVKKNHNHIDSTLDDTIDDPVT